MLAVILSVVLHELAHALAAVSLGLKVKRVTFSLRTGIGVWREPGERWQNALVAAAGPAMTFGLAWMLWVDLPSVAYGNLGFGLFCMFWPGKHSDGYKMFSSLEE